VDPRSATTAAALVGAVVGDALGAATQGLTPAAVRAVHGRVTGILGGGPFSWRPGEATPVGTAVLVGAGWPAASFEPSRDVRTATALASALGAAVVGAEPPGGPYGAVGALAALVGALAPGPPVPLDDALTALAQDGRFRKAVREQVADGLGDALAADAHPLTVAVWAILQPGPWPDTVLEIVNRGGESTVSAALAGGLLAWRDGRSVVPAEWQAAVALVAVVDAGPPT
jgi:hypothetical protein